jgi:hypothetical protein
VDISAENMRSGSINMLLSVGTYFTRDLTLSISSWVRSISLPLK